MNKYAFIRKGAVVQFRLAISDQLMIGTVSHVYSDSIIRDDTRVRIHVIENGHTRIDNRYANELEVVPDLQTIYTK